VSAIALEFRRLTLLIETYHMPASLRYYRDLLGFELMCTSPALGRPHRFPLALLRLGGGEFVLNSACEFDRQRPARPIPHASTRRHLPLCPDVDAAYQELSAKGLAVKTKNYFISNSPLGFFTRCAAWHPWQVLPIVLISADAFSH
jgi:glyoxylase I family protein